MIQPQSAGRGLAAEGLASEPISHWRLAWWRLRRDKVTLVATGVLALIIIGSLLAPVISPYDPNVASLNGNIVNRVAPIGSPGHILGTDEQGRDMLSRIFHGGRMTLLAGVFPVFVALLAGSALGITAGFVGGRTNMLIMRVNDMFYAFPFILLAIAISGALGPGLNNTLISLSIVFTPPITRVAPATPRRERGDLGALYGLRGGGPCQWGWGLRNHPISRSGKRSRARCDLRYDIGRRQHHCGSGSQLSGLGGLSSQC